MRTRADPAWLQGRVTAMAHAEPSQVSRARLSPLYPAVPVTSRARQGKRHHREF
jgi:hypothetical protein